MWLSSFLSLFSLHFSSYFSSYFIFFISLHLSLYCLYPQTWSENGQRGRALADANKTNVERATCFTLLPTAKLLDYIPKASPRSISLFSHWLIPETKHWGPMIKIHYLPNRSNQYLPVHPSTDSPFSLKKKKKLSSRNPCFLALLFCLLFVISTAADAADAAFAALPCPACPYGDNKSPFAKNLASWYILCWFQETTLPHRRIFWSSLYCLVIIKCFLPH